jgi:hypothetical protein
MNGFRNSSNITTLTNCKMQTNKKNDNFNSVQLHTWQPFKFSLLLLPVPEVCTYFDSILSYEDGVS